MGGENFAPNLYNLTKIEHYVGLQIENLCKQLTKRTQQNNLDIAILERIGYYIYATLQCVAWQARNATDCQQKI